MEVEVRICVPWRRFSEGARSVALPGDKLEEIPGTRNNRENPSVQALFGEKAPAKNADPENHVFFLVLLRKKEHRLGTPTRTPRLLLGRVFRRKQSPC